MLDKTISDSVLRSLLKKILLSSDRSPMADVITRIIAARAAGSSVSVGGSEGPFRKTVEQILQRLQIGYTIVDKASLGHVRMHEDKGAKTKHIHVPTYKDRLMDLEFLLPFYLTRENVKIRERRGTEITRIDGLFIPYIHHVLSEYPEIELERVVDDALDNAENEVISIEGLCKSSYLSFDDLYRHLMSLPNPVRAYLGYYLADDESEISCRPLDHPFNHRLRGLMEYCRSEWEQIEASHVWHPPPMLPDFIEVMKVSFYDPVSIGIAARNVYYWTKPQSVEFTDQFRACLAFRSSGKSEEETRLELCFGSQHLYERWLLANHIDICSTNADLWSLESWENAVRTVLGDSFLPGSGFSDTIKSEIKASRHHRKELHDSSRKPVLIVNPRTGVIRLGRMAKRVRVQAVKAAAFALDCQKGNKHGVPKSYFDRKELCKFLNTSLQTKIRDIFRTTLLYPVDPKMRIVKKYPGVKNAYYLDIDVQHSYVDR